MIQSLKVKMRYINFYRGEIRTYMACGGYVMRQDKKSIGLYGSRHRLPRREERLYYQKFDKGDIS